MVNVVIANIVNSSLGSYTAIPGTAAQPGYAFVGGDSGMYVHGNAVALSYNGNSVLEANQSGVYADRVHANVDGQYLTGNLDAEVVIVAGAIDLSTDVIGVLPQQSLPDRIGNVDTLFLGNAGSYQRPTYSFSETDSTGMYLYGEGNVGVSIEGTPTLFVHSNGITVNGFVEGVFVSNATQLTTGTINNDRMPRNIIVDTVGSINAQFENIQSQNLQASGILGQQIQSQTIRASSVEADEVVGNVIRGVFEGVAGNLSIDASQIVNGTLDSSILPKVIDVSEVRGHFTGDGSQIQNISATSITGTIDPARLPRQFQTEDIQVNAIQTEALQALAISGVDADISNVTAQNIHAEQLYSEHAELSGKFRGSFEGDYVGNVWATSIYGDGYGISNIHASNLSGTLTDLVIPDTLTLHDVVANSVQGNGSLLTGLNASQVTSGTLPSDVLPETVSVSYIQSNSAQHTFLQTGNAQMLRADIEDCIVHRAICDTITSNTIVSERLHGNLIGQFQGDVVGNVAGNGVGLLLDASKLMTGTIPNERFEQLVDVTHIHAGTYTGNALGLSNINASNVTHGTLPNDVLPQTVVVNELRTNFTTFEASTGNATQSIAAQFGGLQSTDAQFVTVHSQTAHVRDLDSANIVTSTVNAEVVSLGNAGLMAAAENADGLTITSNGERVAFVSNEFLSLGTCVGYKSGALVLNASKDECIDPLSAGTYVRPIRGTPSSTPVVTYNVQTGELNYNVSTRRQKTNIVDIQRSTSTLHNLRVREYDAIDTQQHHVGFIAEEAYDVDPIFAWKTEDDQVGGLDWFALLTYAIREIQVLRQQLDTLQESSG